MSKASDFNDLINEDKDLYDASVDITKRPEIQNKIKELENKYNVKFTKVRMGVKVSTPKGDVGIKVDVDGNKKEWIVFGPRKGIGTRVSSVSELPQALEKSLKDGLG